MNTNGNAMVRMSVSVCAALALSGATALSAIIVNQTDESTKTASEMYVASATDLINQGQPTFLSQTSSGFSQVFAPITALSDGTAGGYGADSSQAVYSGTTPFTTTFHLNTSGGATQGFDISRIQTITSWGDDKQGQKFTVSYSTVDSNPLGDDVTGFSQFHSVDYAGIANIGGGAVRVTLDITGLTGVNALRFNLQSWNGYSSSVWREIDVFGTVVPEPTSIALLALAGLGLWRRQRR